jgi:PRTRC genetic system protein C
MIVTEIKRVFKLTHEGEKVVIDDPNPSLTPTEVQKLLSGQYPSITNANVSGPKIEDDSAVYEFSNNVGTKG